MSRIRRALAKSDPDWSSTYLGFCEFDAYVGNVADRQNVLGISVFDGSTGHLLPNRLVRILNDRDAAAFLDGIESRRPVIEQAAEYNSYNLRAAFAGCRAEQWIDRRTMPVLP